MLSSYKQHLNAYAQDPLTAPLESRQRYIFDAGTVPTMPNYLVGRVAASVAVGMFVYMSGSDSVSVALNGVTSTEYGIVFSKCDPLTSGAGVPHGIVDSKPGDTIAIVRMLNPASDFDFAGAVAASLYVVGTDAYPATSGDATYPTGVPPYAVGIGLADSKILLLAGIQSSVSSGVTGNFVNALPSTALAVAGPGYFNRTQTLAVGVLNTLGRRVDIEVDITMTASGASTHTAALVIVTGSTTTTLASLSESFSGAGTNTYKIRTTLISQVVGPEDDDGTLRGAHEVIESTAAGTLTITSTTGLDFTVAPIIKVSGGASAGTITLQNLLVRVS